MGGLSIGAVVYIVIGVVVAANRGYLDNLANLGDILSAGLAILVWPLVLLGVRIAV